MTFYRQSKQEFGTVDSKGMQKMTLKDQQLTVTITEHNANDICKQCSYKKNGTTLNH
jgi:hypothetical protein